MGILTIFIQWQADLNVRGRQNTRKRPGFLWEERALFLVLWHTLNASWV